MKRRIIATAILFSNFAFANTIKELEQAYRDKCGGVIYSKCDKGENQLTLLEAAEAESQKASKPVLVIFGFDECGPCVLLERQLKRETALLKKLEENFVLVHIDIITPSGKRAAAYIQTEIRFAPTAVVYSPGNNKKPVKLIAPTDIPSLVDWAMSAK